MSTFSFDIRSASIREAVEFSNRIPEFYQPPGEEAYHQRLDQVRHLVLIAYKDTQAIGFKVGYEREDYLYSWMGGVHPDYRRHGIAKALAEEQHRWAKAQGFKTVRFKTRNRLKAMIIFGMKSGFDIIGFEQKGEQSNYRITLEKAL